VLAETVGVRVLVRDLGQEAAAHGAVGAGQGQGGRPGAPGAQDAVVAAGQLVAVLVDLRAAGVDVAVDGGQALEPLPERGGGGQLLGGAPGLEVETEGAVAGLGRAAVEEVAAVDLGAVVLVTLLFAVDDERLVVAADRRQAGRDRGAAAAIAPAVDP